MRLGGELRELCDRGPLLFQNIHCSCTSLLTGNVTQTAGNAASLILIVAGENPSFRIKYTKVFFRLLQFEFIYAIEYADLHTVLI